jgi:type II secretory ATPase GspE/PulE/Tfp pilus assembly ATPase PilB-like protein/CheY-like chemotaxis protein
MTPPARILAVDDQPANLALVKAILRAPDFEVLEARSGAEALAWAKEGAPDLILLDMHLPDMHGLEVLQRIKESPWGAGLRIVAMSALASADDQALWIQKGCIGSIEKPFTVATFVQQISQWLPGGASSSVPREARETTTPQDVLGGILLTKGLITPQQLKHATAAQATAGKRLGQLLVEQGAVSETDMAWALSAKLGYPYVSVRPDIIDEEAVHLLPEAFLRERHVLPMLKFGQEITLAMVDPTDQSTIDEVVARTGMRVRRALAVSSNIKAMLDALFLRREPVERPVANTEVQYLQFHLVQAMQQGASEIHFEPGIDGQARVRYRLQGVLVDRPGQPSELHAAILHYLRDLTGMGDTALGTAAGTITVGDVDVFLVGTFLPTITGPAATITFHPRRTDVPSLASLGVPEERVTALGGWIRASRGVFLVGCADRWLRSSLLHALIPSLPGGKVWVLETLAVHQRPTLNQTIIKSPREISARLREAARSAADFIAVEDLSRKDAVVAACEVGVDRLVLAGHPQSDVIGVFSQVLDAAGPALIASALRGILAARPIRLLCPTCKQAAPQKPEDRRRRTFVSQGCEACGFTGFHGQRLLTEVWTRDPDVPMLLRSGRLEAAFHRMAKDVGSQFRAQGRALVAEGLVSVTELARVVEEVR